MQDIWLVHVYKDNGPMIEIFISLKEDLNDIFNHLAKYPKKDFRLHTQKLNLPNDYLIVKGASFQKNAVVCFDPVNF